MSDDGKKNPRDNVSPKLKPKDVKNENVAPPGHMGISAPEVGFTPDGNVKVVRMTVDVAVQDTEPTPEPELTPEEQRAAYIDSLPKDTSFTALTGDPSIDDQSIADGDVPVTEEEWQVLRDKFAEQGEEISQSPFDAMMQNDGSTYFQKTNDRQVNKLHEDRGETPVHSVVGDHGLEAGAVDNPFGSKDELKRVFDQAKGREMSRGQSKGPDLG